MDMRTRASPRGCKWGAFLVNLFFCLANAIACARGSHLLSRNGTSYQVLDVELFRQGGSSLGLQKFAEKLRNSTSQDSYPRTDWRSDLKEGVRLDLVHRDAPTSPFRKFGMTREELHTEMLGRENARVQALATHMGNAVSSNHGGFEETSSPAWNRASTMSLRSSSGPALRDPVQSGLNAGTGEYFVTLQVGTPPRNVIATIDTGSDIFWLQCKPCQQCYDQIGPIFDPTQSASFKSLTCTSPVCSELAFSKCGKTTNNCVYAVAYGDGSLTIGDFSQETLTLTSISGRPYKIPQFSLGCGHVNQGLFVGSAGILGLGRGKLSFPTQLAGIVANRFTYCLTDRFVNPNANSHIFFGESATQGLQYTPLTESPHQPAFYYVGLTGITVGHKVISFPSSVYRLDSKGNGGVILDSGTSITRLAEPAYAVFRDSFRAATTYLKRASGDTLFDTCYSITGAATTIPAVNLLFENKASLALPANNILLPVDTQGTFCLAFASSGVAGNISIIGNVQQQNFRIEYDLANSRVGFVGANCAGQ